MTHVFAQESVVIDFASKSRVATPNMSFATPSMTNAPATHPDYLSATGRYEDEDQRQIELANIAKFVEKIRSRIRDIDSRDGTACARTLQPSSGWRIKSLFDCLYWYQHTYDIRSDAGCRSIPEFLHWVENKWGLEEPRIFQLLDQMRHSQRTKGRDRDASMSVRIDSEYSTWAHEELKLSPES
jgi:hypothetical protein